MKSTTAKSSPVEIGKAFFVQDVPAWSMKRRTLLLVTLCLLLFLLGLFYSLLSNDSKARRDILPESLATELELGTQFFETGQLEQAEELYLDLIDDYPGYPHGYNNLASLYALRGDLDEARRLLEQAMSTDADYTTIYRNLGTIYAELARDSYGRALQLEPVDMRTQLQILDMQGAAQLVTTDTLPKPEPETAATSPQLVTEPAPQPEPVSQPEPVEPAETQPVIAAIPDSSAVTEPVLAEETRPAVDETVADTEETVAMTETALGEEAALVEEAAPVAVSEPVVPAEPPAEPVVSDMIPASVAEVAPQTGAAPLETPEQFLQRWAASWAAQDVDAYFSFYADDYLPRNYKTRASWEKKRKSRIIRPAFIKISLADFRIISDTDGEVNVNVIQRYQNDRFQDKIRKRFTLKQNDSGWAIISEVSLGNVD